MQFKHDKDPQDTDKDKKTEEHKSLPDPRGFFGKLSDFLMSCMTPRFL